MINTGLYGALACYSRLTIYHGTVLTSRCTGSLDIAAARYQYLTCIYYHYCIRHVQIYLLNVTPLLLHHHRRFPETWAHCALQERCLKQSLKIISSIYFQSEKPEECFCDLFPIRKGSQSYQSEQNIPMTERSIRFGISFVQSQMPRIKIKIRVDAACQFVFLCEGVGLGGD